MCVRVCMRLIGLAHRRHFLLTSNSIHLCPFASGHCQTIKSNQIACIHILTFIYFFSFFIQFFFKLLVLSFFLLNTFFKNLFFIKQVLGVVCRPADSSKTPPRSLRGKIIFEFEFQKKFLLCSVLFYFFWNIFLFTLLLKLCHTHFSSYFRNKYINI